jgi:MFS family permease
MFVGFIWTALPFLLSKSGVSIEHISQIAAILDVPPILMFLWAPVVDVKLRQRTWLAAAAAVGATCTCLACPLIGPSYYAALSVLLFLGGSVLAIVYASCGGLMATTLSPSRRGKGAAWNTAGNFGGGVLGAAVVLWLAQRVSLQVIGIAIAALILFPAFLAFSISEPPSASGYWFRGRFGEMRREGLAVLRSPRRRWGALLLLSPACTCAAQPLLPALASHYGVDANGVLWINGVAGGIVLAAGSLLGVLVPGNWDRRLIYACAGLTNALGSIVLLAPNRPNFYFGGQHDLPSDCRILPGAGRGAHARCGGAGDQRSRAPGSQPSPPSVRLPLHRWSGLKDGCTTISAPTACFGLMLVEISLFSRLSPQRF